VERPALSLLLTIHLPSSVLPRMSVIGAGVVWRGGASAPAGVYADDARSNSPARRSRNVDMKPEGAS
jgi:hypothetical protein